MGVLFLLFSSITACGLVVRGCQPLTLSYGLLPLLSKLELQMLNACCYPLNLPSSFAYRLCHKAGIFVLLVR